MTTGVVLDCGDGVTTTSAIYEGYSIANATQRMDLGGRDVTAHLMQLLRRAGYSLHTSAEFEIVRQIKEKFCIVEPFSSASSIGIGAGKDTLADNRFTIKKDEAFAGDNRFVLKKETAEKERQAELQTYMLPDGQSMKIGSEKKVAPEILFRPDLIGLEYPGVHEMVVNCI